MSMTDSEAQFAMGSEVVGSEVVRCPFCAAAPAELLSLFGSQLLLSQYRCQSCGSYFEGVRPDRWDQVAGVCDHPDESGVPATGENEDGR
jgi:hypothetical protein